jgi:hypothetical protein
VVAFATSSTLMQRKGTRPSVTDAIEAPMSDVSPKILGYRWGQMHVEGLGVGRDFKLYPGGGRGWDWTETGTEHYPGIQPADVQELLDHGTRVIVFGLGAQRRLRVCPETLHLLEARQIILRLAATPEAVTIYNGLAGREPVGGLFHTTC